jgi:hypothetical protein
MKESVLWAKREGFQRVNKEGYPHMAVKRMRRNPKPNPEPEEKKAYRTHLASVTAVRRFLSSVTNDLRQGKIQAGRAGKIGYLCSVILKTFEMEYEDRITEIEKCLRDH